MHAERGDEPSDHLHTNLAEVTQPTAFRRNLPTLSSPAIPPHLFPSPCRLSPLPARLPIESRKKLTWVKIHSPPPAYLPPPPPPASNLPRHAREGGSPHQVTPTASKMDYCRLAKRLRHNEWIDPFPRKKRESS